MNTVRGINMRKIILIPILLFSFVGISKSQVIIDQEFDGEKGLTYIPFSFFDRKPVFYHPTGFYERTRLFFKYATANKKAPSARFKALTCFNQGDDCPYWNIESKYSNENNSGPIIRGCKRKPQKFPIELNL